MPPAHLPPTPAASGELIIKDSSFQAIDAMSEHSFALPPAALSDSGIANGPNSRKGSMISQPPISPASPERKTSVSSTARAGTKRTAAGTTTVTSSSAALDEFNLPPPPTRSRKIIQMKPKTAPTNRSTPAAATATANKQSPPRKQSTAKSGSVSTATMSKTGNNATATPAEAATTNDATSPQQQSKRKQPSATSAAGRKIARKTAHSLIERRRRSKMNEEFATLKDMIPACRGQEMHKLAILQASIDYMNYLEECITELKNNASTAAGRTNSVSKKPRLNNPPLAPPSPTSPETLVPLTNEDSSSSGSSSPEPVQDNRTTHSATSTYYSSPSFSPYTGPITSSSSQQQIQSLDGINHPILPSPALRPLYSPQIRAQQQQTDLQTQLQSYRVPQQQIASTTPSPAILPQQQHQQQHRQSISSIHTAASMASPVFVAHDSIIDQEASAALLMLNMDRRGASMSEAGGGNEDRKFSLASSSSSSARDKRMGMSVRDLLTS
ncbi:HLH transcription factor, putative [Talaromyces stipitatus ATCC 10500]|uniref:HLH transcription factor, putative n=1 Tax=Talaromyces stipitatus (strain ATCC 10500 / CBS 375.48 / QM 6759 / NRRL 1006) TaxID=441959 RepID=B8LVW2_TALSN|nr:HLH transcription factor, putative [Talaromyces stipitatus ATCC 10500]EED24328.1 HLH transcription factor, putative [Talaromyces stipitatus ATCC 10500]